jgi:hypothetical protein
MCQSLVLLSVVGFDWLIARRSVWDSAPAKALAEARSQYQSLESLGARPSILQQTIRRPRPREPAKSTIKKWLIAFKTADYGSANEDILELFWPRDPDIEIVHNSSSLCEYLAERSAFSNFARIFVHFDRLHSRRARKFSSGEPIFSPKARSHTVCKNFGEKVRA